MWTTLLASAKNWKTTLAAALVAAAAAIEGIAATLDSDPSTVADWNKIVALVVLAVGLFFSRDADTSSQDSGIRPETDMNVRSFVSRKH